MSHQLDLSILCLFDINSLSCSLTSAKAFDGKRGLGQEVWIGEHVFFVDHEAQEGKIWLMHGKRHRVGFPRWVEAVVTCGRRKDRTSSHIIIGPVQPQLSGLNDFARDPSSTSLTVDDGLALLIRVATQLHLHEGAGDAAGELGQVAGGENLRGTNCWRENILRFGAVHAWVTDVPFTLTTR